MKQPMPPPLHATRRWALALLLIGSIVGRSSHAEPTVDDLLHESARPRVIARRGCVEFGPENSVQALNACVAHGIDMVEADVRDTKDGVLVILHDDSLDRMTNLTGRVNELDYRAVQNARLRQGAGGPAAALTGEGIPTLAAMLAAAHGRMPLLLHIKVDHYDAIYGEVVAAGAQAQTAFRIEASPSDAALGGAKFLGHVAYVPVIYECRSVGQTNCCRAGDAGRAPADYSHLHPRACLLGSDEQGFVTQSTAAFSEAGVPIIDGSNEAGTTESRHAGWDGLVQRHAVLILTDRAGELADYLKALPPATHRPPVPASTSMLRWPSAICMRPKTVFSC